MWLLYKMEEGSKTELDGEGFVTKTLHLSPNLYQQLAMHGRWYPGHYLDEWSPRIFLATSVIAAYEVAYGFSLDGHHAAPFSLIAIHRRLIPGEFHLDTHVHISTADEVMIPPRRQRHSLMTYAAIPTKAIAEHLDVPADLLKMAAFRRWIGTKTYKRRI